MTRLQSGSAVCGYCQRGSGFPRGVKREEAAFQMNALFSLLSCKPCICLSLRSVSLPVKP